MRVAPARNPRMRPPAAFEDPRSGGADWRRARSGRPGSVPVRAAPRRLAPRRRPDRRLHLHGPRVGPHAVPAGQPVVTRRNMRCFVAAMVLLWAASDWPIHDIGEQYLYSVHMLQHMMLSYFLPPLALLATPEWLLRVLVGDGRATPCCVVLQAGRRRRPVQPGRDGHPRPGRRQRVGDEHQPGAALLAARDGRDARPC